jgi:glycosyltransferase involved in cell wall biosynthesis
MYVQPAEGFGGAERQGVLHIRRLAEHGVDVVPVVGPGETICRALEREGVTDYYFDKDLLHEADGPLSFFGELRDKAAAFRDWLRMQDRLVRLGRVREVDLVFASRAFGWVVASPAAHRLGVPLVWRGGSRPTSLGERLGLRALSRLWPPDALIANCEAVRTPLLPLVRPRVSYILPNGVDVDRFDPARVDGRFRRLPGLAPGAPIIGFSGRPAPEKGLELLAAVAGRLAHDVPDARLLLAGEFGYRSRYEDLFRRLGLARRATFLGHVEDVESFYASCDVIVLPSREHSIEGSPNAVLEAMAMERPIVATRVGGLPEVVTDGREGYLVPWDDAPGIAAALVRLLQAPELRRRMGAAGRAAVLARYSDRTVVQRLVGVLHAVSVRSLDARRRTPALPARPVHQAEAAHPAG